MINTKAYKQLSRN